jgi:hypothetical protein
VCVKKIPATSKFLELKKLNELKFSFVIFILSFENYSAKVIDIFECAKKREKNL